MEITGLRNPCVQLDAFLPGLMEATLARAADGSVARRAGVMAVVLTPGEVVAGDPIHVELPDPPHVPLTPVCTPGGVSGAVRGAPTGPSRTPNRGS